MSASKDTPGMAALSTVIGRRAAKEVLSRYRLSDLLYLDKRSLVTMRYIGPRRAETILALPKLLHQMVCKPTEGLSISCSQDVYELYRFRMAALPMEQFLVLTLNTRNRILSEELCAAGGINTVHVQPLEVIRQAVLRSAPSIICIHNHPSGDPTPSPEDRILTERISQAASLLGVRMLDHVILASQSYYSFSDAGAL